MVDSRLFIGLLMIGIGLSIFIGIGLGMYVLQVTVAEPVDAEVQSKNITAVPCSVDETCRNRYAPVIEYKYDYKGEEYTSEQVFPDGSFSRASTRDRPEEIISKYSEGGKTTAYLVPGFPKSSYLQKKAPDLASTLLGLFGLLLVLGGIGGIKDGLTGN